MKALTAVAVAAAGTIAGLAVSHAGPGITAIAPVRSRLFPRLAGVGQSGHVALTFDDGPDPTYTPAFLEVLAAHQVKATFFLLGTMVTKAPRLAADITAAGHEVGVHGWQHNYTVLTTPHALLGELTRARDAIAEASGTVPRFYRPPYGVLSRGALSAAKRLALTPVLWTCWGQEWTAGATAESVHATLSRDLAGGSTVLLHDSDCTSPPGSAAAALGALPKLLSGCREVGLGVGPLCEHGL